MSIDTTSTAALLKSAELIYKNLKGIIDSHMKELPESYGKVPRVGQFGISANLFVPIMDELESRSVPIPADIKEFYIMIKEELSNV